MDWILVISVITSSTFFADKHYREIPYPSEAACLVASKNVSITMPKSTSDDPPIVIIYCKPTKGVTRGERF